MNLLNKIFLIYFFIITMGFAQTTYFVSYNEGNDNFDGKNENTAWKTISKVNSSKFIPGDRILFQRNNIWENGEGLVITESGTSNNRITYGAYGNGNKPILSLISPIKNWQDSRSWTNLGNNIWRIQIEGKLSSGKISRLWLNNVQYKRAETKDSYWDNTLAVPRNTFGLDDEYIFVSYDNFLYLYSSLNPADKYSSILTTLNESFENMIDIQSANYITIENLEIRGGKTSIIAKGCDFLVITDCSVNMQDMRGIYLTHYNGDFSENCIIKSNILNANWKDLFGGQYEYYSTPWSPSSTFLTVNIGIEFYDGTKNNKAYNNKLYDFYFSAFRIMGKDYGSTNHEVYENEVYCDNIPLGRFAHIIAYSMNENICSNNKFYKNYCSNPGLNLEVGGNNNYLYFNIIDKGKNSRPFIYYSGQGVGISCEAGSPDGHSTNNFIFNNTIYNVESQPLRVWGKQHNVFNNLVLNGGDGSNNYKFGDQNVNANILNNCVYEEGKSKSDKLVSYGNPGKSYNMSELNSVDNNNSDEINGNFQLTGSIESIVYNANNSNFKIIGGNALDKSGIDISKYIDANFTDLYGNNIEPQNPPIGAAGPNSSNNTSSTKTELKVLLEGSYADNQMQLQLLDDLPTLQPYSVSPWNYSGNETISSNSSNYVDWLLIELRNSNGDRVSQFAAVLKNDGNIVNYQGNDDFSIYNIDDGSYYIVITHRNHLSIISSQMVKISNSEFSYDFSDSPSKAQGETSLKELGNNKYGMFSGDSDGNGIINNLDFGAVINNIYKSGYWIGDLDMNGIVNVLDYSNIKSNFHKTSFVPIK